MTLEYRLGSIVRVSLYTGQTVIGEVKAIFDTVAGRKINVAWGECHCGKIDGGQVVDVLRY